MNFDYKQKLLVGTLALALATGLASPAFADENGVVISASDVNSSLADRPVTATAAISPNGDWFEFAFDDVGVNSSGCFDADPLGPVCGASSGTPTAFAPSPAWTFDCPSGCMLTVTDAFQNGDEFEIFDNALRRSPGCQRQT